MQNSLVWSFLTSLAHVITGTNDGDSGVGLCAWPNEKSRVCRKNDDWRNKCNKNGKGVEYSSSGEQYNGSWNNDKLNDKLTFNILRIYSDSKNNQTSSHTTAADTNVVGHSFSAGYDFTLNEIISASAGLGYGDSNAKEDTNDYENYDLDLRVNFALPFAYISIGNLTSMVDYSLIDSSLNSNLLRSDLTNTSDIMITKAIGDFLPIIDPNKDFFITLSYEKVISESNILNYDYVGESFSIGFNKACLLYTSPSPRD